MCLVIIKVEYNLSILNITKEMLNITKEKTIFLPALRLIIYTSNFKCYYSQNLFEKKTGDFLS